MTPAPVEPAVYTVDEFCHAYGVGRTNFYALIARGDLTARKVGKRTVVPRAEAERWLSALPAWTPETAARAPRRKSAPTGEIRP